MPKIDFVLRLSVDREYLAYMAYRAVLRRIVELDSDQPWTSTPEAELADRVLKYFGDDTPSGQQGGGNEHAD